MFDNKWNKEISIDSKQGKSNRKDQIQRWLSASFPRTHPEYLETLSYNHTQWSFGALDEIIDNSRDANASGKARIQFQHGSNRRIPGAIM